MFDFIKGNKAAIAAGLVVTVVPTMLAWVKANSDELADLRIEVRAAFATLAATEQRSLDNAVQTEANSRVQAILVRLVAGDPQIDPEVLQQILEMLVAQEEYHTGDGPGGEPKPMRIDLNMKLHNAKPKPQPLDEKQLDNYIQRSVHQQGIKK